MSLRQYHAKRDFSATPEPPGAEEPQPVEERRFVVQRHRARRLHYDFRLEVDGVLASWAVPKGPTLDPSVRSLAVHVEDHPIEYRDFEGVIPTGQYGGGDVIVWDRGTWQPAKEGDPAEAIANGEIHFDLFGEKLRGRFVLVRTRGRDGGQDQWLMLHKHDDWAVSGWNPEDHPASVKSGRTNDEVAADPDALWRSDLPASKAEQLIKPAAEVRQLPDWSAPSEEELSALDSLGAAGRWDLQGTELQLTNLDKILFPGREGETPLTKRDLIRYYACTAHVMLPYLIDRPVNLHRYPNGSDRPGFWHKEVPNHAPAWLERWRNEDADPGESRWYFVLNSPAALAWMGNYGAIELHPWTSRVEDVNQPTYAYIDIDPGPATSFEDVLVLARLFRAGLDHLGVFGLPKVTGQRGIHIWVPVRSGYTYQQTRIWTEKLSRAVGATIPELVSWEWEKGRRKGLARLDYTQNARNKTLVAPYSVRPAAGAPVSMPIEWDELDDPLLRPDRWTIRSAPERLAAIPDPFRGLIGREQSLPDL